MLNDNEKKILDILNTRHLLTKKELLLMLEKDNMNGADISMGRLKDKGLIDNVQNLGNCIVITKLGLRALRDDR